MKDTLPLFKSYPQIEENIPWIAIGNYPSPVERLSSLERILRADEIWIKRDDLCLVYTGGGIMVRKLEFILAYALSKGVKTLITIGRLGSNHALALTAHSRNLGFKSVLVLFNQPNACQVRNNLILDSYFCAEMHYCRFLYEDSSNSHEGILQVPFIWQ
ncbi:MAG: hypothetical protein C4291_01315 [Candidatus Dadabacteria bacterium]